MNRIFKPFLLSLALFIVGIAPTAAFASSNGWTYPAIKGYGPVHPLPHAAVQPRKHKIYKAMFNVTAGISNATKPEAGLAHVARAVNVFASAGIPLKHLEFVAVVHGPATPAILNNTSYRKKYGVGNPNLKLIGMLRKAGVKVEVCGQALADLHFKHSWVDRKVVITLSALSDSVIYGDAGYAFVQL